MVDESLGVTIETDAALTRLVGDQVADLFPDAEVEIYGPIAKSAETELIQWLLAGSLTTFTITGGIGPVIGSVRASVEMIRAAYGEARERGTTLQPTTIKYMDKEVVLDISSPDPDAAVRGVHELLQPGRSDKD